MADWFTADLHFGHDKVTAIRGYAPYLRDHDTKVYRGLAEALAAGDNLWILGDLSNGTPAGEAGAIKWLERLVRETGARIHLIAGNHDSVHPLSSQAHKAAEKYRRGPFESVASQGTLKIDGERAVLSHFPYEGDHTPTDRHQQHRPRDLGTTIIHGHTHALQPVTYSTTGAVQVCVSVDAWGLRPVKKETLQNTIREAKALRDGKENT